MWRYQCIYIYICILFRSACVWVCACRWIMSARTLLDTCKYLSIFLCICRLASVEEDIKLKVHFEIYVYTFMSMNVRIYLFVLFHLLQSEDNKNTFPFPLLPMPHIKYLQRKNYRKQIFSTLDTAFPAKALRVEVLDSVWISWPSQCSRLILNHQTELMRCPRELVLFFVTRVYWPGSC